MSNFEGFTEGDVINAHGMGQGQVLGDLKAWAELHLRKLDNGDALDVRILLQRLTSMTWLDDVLNVERNSTNDDHLHDVPKPR